MSRASCVCRDIKPDNIVLEGGVTGGRVFLVDFGGVQAVAAGESFALGSTVIGTYGYMAPEQFRGAAQPASDLYGLGGTLLYLLSGLSAADASTDYPASCPTLRHFLEKHTRSKRRVKLFHDSLLQHARLCYSFYHWQPHKLEV